MLRIVGEPTVGGQSVAAGDFCAVQALCEGGAQLLCRFTWLRSVDVVGEHSTAWLPVPGANKPVYVPGPDDVGAWLKVTATPQHPACEGLVMESEAVGPVLPAHDDAHTTPPHTRLADLSGRAPVWQPSQQQQQQQRPSVAPPPRTIAAGAAPAHGTGGAAAALLGTLQGLSSSLAASRNARRQATVPAGGDTAAVQAEAEEEQGPSQQQQQRQPVHEASAEEPPHPRPPQLPPQVAASELELRLRQLLAQQQAALSEQLTQLGERLLSPERPAQLRASATHSDGDGDDSSHEVVFSFGASLSGSPKGHAAGSVASSPPHVQDVPMLAPASVAARNAEPPVPSEPSASASPRALSTASAAPSPQATARGCCLGGAHSLSLGGSYGTAAQPPAASLTRFPPAAGSPAQPQSSPSPQAWLQAAAASPPSPSPPPSVSATSGGGGLAEVRQLLRRLAGDSDADSGGGAATGPQHALSPPELAQASNSGDWAWQQQERQRRPGVSEASLQGLSDEIAAGMASVTRALTALGTAHDSPAHGGGHAFVRLPASRSLSPRPFPDLGASAADDVADDAEHAAGSRDGAAGIVGGGGERLSLAQVASLAAAQQRAARAREQQEEEEGGDKQAWQSDLPEEMQAGMAEVLRALGALHTNRARPTWQDAGGRSRGGTTVLGAHSSATTTGRGCPPVPPPCVPPGIRIGSPNLLIASAPSCGVLTRMQREEAEVEALLASLGGARSEGGWGGKGRAGSGEGVASEGPSEATPPAYASPPLRGARSAGGAVTVAASHARSASPSAPPQAGFGGLQGSSADTSAWYGAATGVASPPRCSDGAASPRSTRTPMPSHHHVNRAATAMASPRGTPVLAGRVPSSREASHSPPLEVTAAAHVRLASPAVATSHRPLVGDDVLLLTLFGRIEQLYECGDGGRGEEEDGARVVDQSPRASSVAPAAAASPVIVHQPTTASPAEPPQASVPAPLASVPAPAPPDAAAADASEGPYAPPGSGGKTVEELLSVLAAEREAHTQHVALLAAQVTRWQRVAWRYASEWKKAQAKLKGAAWKP